MDTNIIFENGLSYAELKSKITDYDHNQFEEVLEDNILIDSNCSHEDGAETEKINSLYNLIQSWGFDSETFKLLRCKFLSN